MVKVGDLVVAQGQNGVFVVRRILAGKATAEIELFNVSKQQATGHKITAPRTTLFPFKEDSSQAAVRIVRDATEDK